MTEAAKSGVDNPYRYSTKEWDEKSGLYYFGARYYSPEIGRWTQRDPAGTVDGLNLYAYALNDAVNANDPTGAKITTQECWGFALRDYNWAVENMFTRIRDMPGALVQPRGPLNAWVDRIEKFGDVINVREERGLWRIRGGCCRVRRTVFRRLLAKDICRWTYNLRIVIGSPGGEHTSRMLPWEDSKEDPEWWVWKSIWYYDYDECDESWRG